MQLLTSMTTMMATLLVMIQYIVCLRMKEIIIGQASAVQETLKRIRKENGAFMSKIMTLIDGIMKMKGLATLV